MAEIYYPFESLNTGTASDPVYDRAITAEMERAFNKLRYTNGVFSSVGSGLAVSANNNMIVTVGTGGAHIEGAMYINTVPLNLTVEAANASLNRIDRVVLQFNTSVSVRSVRALIRTGTAATNPVAPELRQESNLYEIALADIYVKKGATGISQSAVTDQRLNSALCGFVVAAIPSSVDTTGLFDQYQTALNEWLDTVAAALDDTLAGNLQNQITALGTRLTTEENKVQPLNKGGTGKTTRAEAMNYLQYIPASALSFLTGSGAGDTTANWVTAGTGLAYISTEGLLENQPMKYGWLYNFTAGSVILAQQFIGLDGNSPVWYRSGNASGWYPGSKNWVRSLDEKNGVQIKKVWQNASPGSNFLEQLIKLNVADASFILVVFKITTTSNLWKVAILTCDGNAYIMDAPYNTDYSSSGTVIGTAFRGAIWKNNGIQFGKGYSKDHLDKNPVERPSFIIPIKIFVVKGAI